MLIDFGYTPEVLLNNLAHPQDRPVRFDAHGLEPRPLRPFRRHGRLSWPRTKGKLKSKMPFLDVGGEDTFCLRRNPGGNFGALDRKAILDADLALMLAAEPALVADHAFTTGRIGNIPSETPLRDTRRDRRYLRRLRLLPGQYAGVRTLAQTCPTISSTNSPLVYLVKDRGLVVLTSCSHRGVINTRHQAMAASGVDRVHAVIGGFHVVPPLGDDYIDEKTIAEFRAIDPESPRWSAIAPATASMISRAQRWATRWCIRRSARALCSARIKTPDRPGRTCRRRVETLLAPADNSGRYSWRARRSRRPFPCRRAVHRRARGSPRPARSADRW